MYVRISQQVGAHAACQILKGLRVFQGREARMLGKEILGGPHDFEAFFFGWRSTDFFFPLVDKQFEEEKKTWRDERGKKNLDNEGQSLNQKLAMSKVAVNYNPLERDPRIARLYLLDEILAVARAFPDKVAELLGAVLDRSADALSDEFVEQLTALGLDLDQPSSLYASSNKKLVLTPLQSACERHQAEAICALVGAGANPNGRPAGYTGDGTFCLDALLGNGPATPDNADAIESCLRILTKSKNLVYCLSASTRDTPSFAACMRHSPYISDVVDACV